MARHCKRFCSLLATVCGATMLLPCRPAQAYEEQASIDAALGYALVIDDGSKLPGVSIDLGASLGVTDAIVARATAGYAMLVDRPELPQLGRLRLEAIYLLDVLQVVPFFGLGGTLTNNPDHAAPLPVWIGGQLVLGVDYLVSREWVVGVDIRSALLIEGRGDRLYSTDVALRLSRMFEMF